MFNSLTYSSLKQFLSSYLFTSTHRRCSVFLFSLHVGWFLRRSYFRQSFPFAWRLNLSYRRIQASMYLSIWFLDHLFRSCKRKMNHRYIGRQMQKTSDYAVHCFLHFVSRFLWLPRHVFQFPHKVPLYDPEFVLSLRSILFKLILISTLCSLEKNLKYCFIKLILICERNFLEITVQHRTSCF